MCDWIAAVCKWIVPVYEAMWLQVKAGGILHGDESPIKVLDRDGPTGILRGYMWVFVGAGQVVFHFGEGRGQDFAARFLKGFRGFLHTDAYASYNLAERLEEIIRLACWAHYLESTLIQRVTPKERNFSKNIEV
jgi:hypothetical protein